TDAHTVTAQTWSHSREFYVGSTCAIATPDHVNASLMDLRAGEKIKVHYQTQGNMRIAHRIEVVPLYLTGTVLAVDSKDRMLTVEEKLHHRTLRVARNCKVILANDRPGTLADLAPGSRVLVAYDAPGAPPRAYRIEELSQTSVLLK